MTATRTPLVDFLANSDGADGRIRQTAVYREKVSEFKEYKLRLTGESEAEPLAARYRLGPRYAK